jgi:diadenosine tetraphosphate (Ap4A) HIT family hydrolase
MPFELHPDLKRDGIPIGEFPLCLVLLINDSNYPWFVLVPQLENLRELTDLTGEEHQIFWAESRAFSAGIMQAFSGEKLNVAALGNMTPQLHVHHVVRYSKDAAWPGPIWGKLPLKPYDQTGVDRVREKLSAAKIAGLVDAKN